MKQSLLIFVCVLFLNVSMCGSKSSYSKTSRGSNIIEELFEEYQDKHEKSNEIYQSSQEKLSEISEQLKAWRQSKSLAQRFWLKAGMYSTNLDSLNKKRMDSYLIEKQKDFKTQYRNTLNQDSIIQTQVLELKQQMEVYKIKASHSQMISNINAISPKSEELSKTIKELKAITTRLEELEKQNF